MFGSNENKPSAMEAMVAKMLGFTPEQMQETITGFRDTIVAVAEALKRIEEKQGLILDKMEAAENDLRERDNAGGSGDSRGRRRNGGGGKSAAGNVAILPVSGSIVGNGASGDG